MNSATGAPRGRRPLLDVESVIESALHLLDTEGLPAVTFRRLSTELGVSHMTLYGYFASKHELLEALVARTLAESMSAVGDSLTWDEALLRRMREVHAALLGRPGIAELLVTREFAGPPLARIREELLDVLRAAGYREPQVTDGISVLFNYVFGDALVETRRGRGGSPASFEMGMGYLIAGLRRDLEGCGGAGGR